MKKEWVAVTTASDDRISQKTVSQEPSKDGGIQVVSVSDMS